MATGHTLRLPTLTDLSLDITNALNPHEPSISPKVGQSHRRQRAKMRVCAVRHRTCHQLRRMFRAVRTSARAGSAASERDLCNPLVCYNQLVFYNCVTS